MAGALHLSGIWKSYGDEEVLCGVDLDVASGALAAVLGPSGCGKTTLLRVVAGLVRADAGVVELDGQTLADDDRHVAPERRRIGIVPQDGSLFPHLDVGGNIAFGLPRAERRHPGRSSRVRELAELVGLSSLLSRLPHELSGGQQQRVALARCLAPAPAVVLLDEPFAALDAALRIDLRRDVQRVLAATRTTAVLVTHDQDEALSMAATVAVLRRGTVVQTGTPRELYERPADLELAAFLGEAVILDGVLDASASEVQCALGRVPVRGATSNTSAVTLLAGERVRLLLRPEQLCVAEAGAMPPEPGEAHGGVPGIVERVDYHGFESLAHVRLDGGASVTVRLSGAGPLSTGAVVRVGVSGLGQVYR